MNRIPLDLFGLTLVENPEPVQFRESLMNRSSSFESVHVHPCQLSNQSCHSGIVNVLRTQDLAINPLGNQQESFLEHALGSTNLLQHFKINNQKLELALSLSNNNFLLILGITNGQQQAFRYEQDGIDPGICSTFTYVF